MEDFVYEQKLYEVQVISVSIESMLNFVEQMGVTPNYTTKVHNKIK